jgi:hypothetical protein
MFPSLTCSEPRPEPRRHATFSQATDAQMLLTILGFTASSTNQVRLSAIVGPSRLFISLLVISNEMSYEKSMRIPDEFICPITQEIMRSPLMCRSGHTFERSAILTWLKDHGNTNPLTRDRLSPSGLVTNHALEARISSWCKENNVRCKKMSEQGTVEVTHLFTCKVSVLAR